ncbi:nuclear protein SNF4 [Verticillium dahliae VdLs.17]|uniref:Nuclear protein SNF4 n=1 Tax=Verticillium dahliae (strain VdLs.17 / ATCC MYA-4575 / FGSC 10137) TaxID=498257 RepID=G2XGI1_VERDV|nr:nuclear protein SNF4 [Verticillium dahliae VdLs.17]EGY18929.1 nuclear protein SNF4 [Verticillium dahliae VdLs.17]
MPDHDMDLENNPAAAAPADSGAEAGTVPGPRVTVAAEVAAAAFPPPPPPPPPPHIRSSDSTTIVFRPKAQRRPQWQWNTGASRLRYRGLDCQTERFLLLCFPRAIREFLKVRTSYDVLPLSFRLIVLDNDLLIKKSLNILIQNYIEKAIGVSPLETVSVNPMRPLYEACRRMLKTKARRIPLVDLDDETRRETVVSVITQYRILKFIAVNNEHNTVMLKKAVRDVGLGTWGHIATAHMSTSVLDVVSLMVKHDISCVPLVDKHNRLLNVFEAVDIIPCIKGGAYDDLSSSVGEALCKRPDDFPGIYTCGPEDRLDSIFDTVRKSRVHRLIVVDDENRLVGIISLSDILKYVLLHGEEDDLR